MSIDHDLFAVGQGHDEENGPVRLEVVEDNVNGTPMSSDETSVGVTGDVAGEEESFAGNGVSLLNVLTRESLRWPMMPESGERFSTRHARGRGRGTTPPTPPPPQE